MISRKAKKLVPAREQLQALTPAELTEVSGGRQDHRPGGGGEGGVREEIFKPLCAARFSCSCGPSPPWTDRARLED